MATCLRVLVLDDCVDVAEGLAEILEFEGHYVTLAHDGESAVRLYDQKDFDVGIFDIRMPGMNGVEVLLTVRKVHRDAAIIMMSGYADGTLISTALENGALGLLTKPFEPDDLFGRLNQVMESRSVPTAATPNS